MYYILKINIIIFDIYIYAYILLYLIYIYTYIYSLIHSVTKNLAEHGEKIDEATKSEIQVAIDTAKKINADASLETLKDSISTLSNVSMKIGQAMYGKKSDDESENKSDSNNSNSNENKTGKEAEYEEKK